MEDYVLRLVSFSLECLADRFSHTNVCDNWEDYYKDSTPQERFNARRIVEFMEECSDDMASFLIELYEKEMKKR